MLRWSLLLVFLLLTVAATGASGKGVNGGGLDGEPIPGRSVAGHGLTNWGGGGGDAFADCDYGGDLTTPLLAWDLSQHRTSDFNWWSYDNEAGTVPDGDAGTMRCRSTNDGTVPRCGAEMASGGPGGGPWIDFENGVGVNHQRGLRKKSTHSLETDMTTEATFAIWVKKTANFTYFENLYDKGYRYTIQSGTNEIICMDHDILSGSPANDCTSTDPFSEAVFSPDGKWHLLVFVWEDGASNSGESWNRRWYKDGVFVEGASESTINFGDSAFTMVIGSLHVFSGLYAGIAYPQVWDVALSAAEITHIQSCRVPVI